METRDRLMQPVFISVIMPTFNSRDTIVRALSSLIRQTFQDFEIIIVDGRSTDDTLVRIDEFKDKRIKLFSETDKGVYDAMNKGMSIAQGAWLYFFGSDDELYDETVFHDFHKIAESSKKSIVYGNIKIVHDTPWAKNGSIYNGEFDLKKLFKTNIGHQAIFYKKHFLDAIGNYNIKYPQCADWDLNLRCRAKTEFLYFDRVIAYFYGGGISTRNKGDQIFFQDFLSNIMSYFHLDVFDPLLNNDSFPRFYDVLRLQRKTNLIRYFFNRVKRKLNRSTITTYTL